MGTLKLCTVPDEDDGDAALAVLAGVCSVPVCFIWASTASMMALISVSVGGTTGATPDAERGSRSALIPPRTHDNFDWPDSGLLKMVSARPIRLDTSGPRVPTANCTAVRTTGIAATPDAER